MSHPRPKQSIYIIFSCHVTEELRDFYVIINDLFKNNTPEKVVNLKDRIKNLTGYVDKIPTYGKPGSSGQRKVKYSMFYEQRTFIIFELTGINANIDEALNMGRGKILKYAEILTRIKELGIYVNKIRVYFYKNKFENRELERYRERYRKFKESFKKSPM